MWVLFRVPQNKVASLVLILCGGRGRSLALCTDGALVFICDGTNGGKVLVEAGNKIVVVMPWGKRLREAKAMIISCAKLQLSRGETAKFCVGTDSHDVVDERQYSIRGPLVSESFVMYETTEMPHEETVSVFGAI